MNVENIEGEGKLNSSRIRLIRTSAKLGELLQINVVDIGQKYVEGLSISQIVNSENIMQKYSVGRNVAIAAVRFAIRGYNGKLYSHYEGKVEDVSLLEKISLEHKSASGEKTAKIHRERKSGFFAYTKEDLSKKGQKSAIARGKELVGEDEILYALSLYESSRNLGWKYIVSEVNSKFSKKRTVPSVQKYVYRRLKEVKNAK